MSRHRDDSRGVHPAGHAVAAGVAATVASGAGLFLAKIGADRDADVDRGHGRAVPASARVVAALLPGSGKTIQLDWIVELGEFRFAQAGSRVLGSVRSFISQVFHDKKYNIFP